ncbi:MAG: hypothetical protein FJ279_03765 [Planctomycetes bacterium]|nr:hypothetical protein [Planctomycetota bacterium]
MNPPEVRQEEACRNFARQLRSHEKSIKVAACTFFAAQGQRAMPYLMEVLQDDAADDLARGYASDLLRRLGDAAVPSLRETLLGKTSENTKLYAAATLGVIRTEESARVLLEGLLSGNEKVDREIVNSFRKQGRVALELLIHQASAAKTQGEHTRSIVGIAKFAGDRGYPGTVALIQRLSGPMRLRAVTAFENRVGSSAMAAGLLCEMLRQEKQSRPLMATIAAIRRLRVVEAKDALQAMADAKETPVLVRQAVRGALAVFSKETDRSPRPA